MKEQEQPNLDSLGPIEYAKFALTMELAFGRITRLEYDQAIYALAVLQYDINNPGVIQDIKQ